MNQQLAHTMKESDFTRFDTRLLFQCAPVLMQLKVSNLLIINKSELLQLASIDLPEPITYHLLYENETRMIYLVYHKAALEELIKREEYQVLFNYLGYTGNALSDIIAELSYRYEKSINGKEEFPHEIGLLLGIPIVDVIGFIFDKDNKIKQAGEWKVYQNEQESEKWFLIYEKARTVLLDLLNRQMEVQSLLSLL